MSESESDSETSRRAKRKGKKSFKTPYSGPLTRAKGRSESNLPTRPVEPIEAGEAGPSILRKVATKANLVELGDSSQSSEGSQENSMSDNEAEQVGNDQAQVVPNLVPVMAQNVGQAVAPDPDLKLLAGMPRKFSEQTFVSPAAHILSFNDYLKAHNVQDDRQKIFRFAMSLEGKPRRWMEDKEFASYEDLKRDFLGYHSGMLSRESSARYFRNLHFELGETIPEYLTRLKDCAKRLGYGPDMIKDQFLSGLPEKLLNLVGTMGDRPIEDIVGAAQRQLDLAKADSKPLILPSDLGIVAAQGDRDSTTAARIDELTLQVDKLAKAVTYPDPDRRGPTQPGPYWPTAMAAQQGNYNPGPSYGENMTDPQAGQYFSGDNQGSGNPYMGGQYNYRGRGRGQWGGYGRGGFQSFRGGWRGRGRARGRGGFNNPFFGRFSCFNCGGEGHMKRECPSYGRGNFAASPQQEQGSNPPATQKQTPKKKQNKNSQGEQDF